LQADLAFEEADAQDSRVLFVFVVAEMRSRAERRKRSVLGEE